MEASHPAARSCSRNHWARSCSRNVGAGTRQSWRWVSLIHCFSRVNHCRHSRTPRSSANSPILNPAAAFDAMWSNPVYQWGRGRTLQPAVTRTRPLPCDRLEDPLPFFLPESLHPFDDCSQQICATLELLSVSHADDQLAACVLPTPSGSSCVTQDCEGLTEGRHWYPKTLERFT